MTTETLRLPQAAEDYLARVMKELPRPLPERGRIEDELRSHLADRLEAAMGGMVPDPPGDSAAGARGGDAVAAEQAFSRMAPPEEVARDYLAEISFEDAPLGKRVGAFLVDALAGTVALTPIWIFLWLSFLPQLDLQPPLSYGWVLLPLLFITKMAAAVAILSVVYFPIMEAIWGRTLGKWLLGIYVTREDGRAAGWVPAILRRLSFILEIFWIDAVFALFTKRRQRAFDLVARTVVVRER